MNRFVAGAIVRCASAVVVAVAVAALIRAAAALAYAPHELRWADNQDISSLNMFLSTSANISPLSELTMGEFTRLDAQGNVIPELVTAIPSKANGGVSADGRTVTWHLRHGVKWSDGVPFDASDVTYTFRVAIDPANAISSRDIWNRLAAVTAPDPYTVVFHFKQPYALFVEDYFSSVGTSCVLPKHILGPGTAINQAPFNAAPVGIGPFRYTVYHRGDDVEMEANPYYWRGAPKLQRVVYKIVTDENTLFTQLETGELDLWDVINGALAQRVKTIPGHAYDTRLSNYEESIYFNVQHPVVGDPAVRRALELAVDRPAILEKVALGNGVLSQSVVPRTAQGYVPLPLTPYDPAAASKLLDAAGWTLGADHLRHKNGVVLSIDLAIPAGQPTRATTAAVIRDDWAAIGVDVQIHPWAAAQYFAPSGDGGIIEAGRFDAAIAAGGLGPLYANLDDWFTCASIPPNGFNISRYCNRDVDALNDRYLDSFDPAQRARIAADFQHRLNADVPAIVLYERTFLDARDARLTGYQPSAFSYWGDPLRLDL